MIIIGDVHGCYRTLMKLIEQFPKDQKICFVGDLVDRGNDSRKVLDFVLNNRYDCVLGNHEEMMMDNAEMWYFNGGLDTMQSFGGDYKVLKEYQERIKLNFPYYKIYDDVVDKNGRKLFLSHAGLCREDIESCCSDGMLTWYRGEMYDRKDLFQVFGHTPNKEPITTDFYANIDTGAVYHKRFGTLTALQFPEMIYYKQANIEIYE